MHPGDTQTELSPRAGQSERFPSGELTFLSPKPLPTGLPPVDHGHAVGELHDGYLDFGTGMPPVFGWQMALGGPLFCFLFIAFGIPMILSGLALAHGRELETAVEVFQEMFGYGFWIAVWGCSFFLLLGLTICYRDHLKLESIIPARFNRQRREVCFVPESQKEPIFVPWEDLVAWVTEAQGVTEYGVQHQYGFGIGFYHPETGEKYTLEFETYGQPQAISTWEAIRAYMEYDVHTLKEIQDPLELQGPDDPPWEGVHVFRNARKRLHEEYRDGKRGLLYLIGWYLYHLITFWTIPNRLVEWEVNKIKRMSGKTLPRAMAEWSESIPEEQWAKPSKELKCQSKRVLELLKANPQRPVTEIFAQVDEEFSTKTTMTA
ncbi:hypothetical protein MYE70_12290 [Marinobacter alexandrii]|uniref:DUF6708 domain-containing protein n=1 Tax=Marinobacter alexandrii TaxID=2570351 RepID=UPI001FFFF141|nr:DUF6708 domain-containing protein [Marinobacter alexandrii]MCK2149838.1 hypothetical protein [Marinobacter alexandrii]